MILQHKRIVIIGGTTGMGLSAAKCFIEAGAQIVATGIDELSCAEAARLFGDSGRACCLDARTPGTAREAIQLCIRDFGGFDGLYHVAGGSGRKWGDGPLHQMTLKGWSQTFELNLTSVMLSNQAAVQIWLERQQAGSILNLSSVLSISPAPHFFSTHAYATSKAAIIGFSKSIASYYAPENIRINVISPALVETPMSKRAQTNPEIMTYIRSKQPLDGGRIGRPADLDQLACFFLSDHARFTTGQHIAVDGGWSLSEGQYLKQEA